MKGHVLSGFTNNARIAYVTKINGTQNAEKFVFANHLTGNIGTVGYSRKVNNGTTVASDAPDFYWTLVDGRLVANNTVEFSLTGLDEYVEIVPLKQNGKATEFFAIAKRDANGNLQYVEESSGSFVWSAYKSTSYSQNIASAALFVSVETAYTEAYTGTELNNFLKEGFNLTISSLKDENAEITHSEAFSGVLKAMEDKDNLSTTRNYYHLMNEDCLLYTSPSPRDRG